jgi:hypothetical protein
MPLPKVRQLTAYGEVFDKDAFDQWAFRTGAQKPREVFDKDAFDNSAFRVGVQKKARTLPPLR